MQYIIITQKQKFVKSFPAINKNLTNIFLYKTLEILVNS